MEGGPNQVTEAPSGACEGCEKEKSNRLPFPASKSRASRPLDLVHSNLDECPIHSISSHKWTTAHLDDHSSFGVMFYLKSKDEEFTTFKLHKAWAERQLGTMLKCKWTDWGGEFLSNKQKTYLKENGIKHQKSMPDLPQQNGQAERFHQTIVNRSESMWHHVGLSEGFWVHAVKAKIHMYNIRPIKRADYKTSYELFKGVKPDISHLRVFGCLAWVHILKKRRDKPKPKSWEMILVSDKPGSKRYQFWDAANWCFEISHDVKFEESHFPAKEKATVEKKFLENPKTTTTSHCQIPQELNDDSDLSNLDLVNLTHPTQGPPKPGPPAQRTPQPQPPVVPPLALTRSTNVPLPDEGAAPTPWYSLHPRNVQGQVIGQSRTSESLNSFLINISGCPQLILRSNGFTR